MVIVVPCGIQSGCLVLARELNVHCIGGPKDHPARDACTNFDLLDGAVANGVQGGKQQFQLRAENEITQVLFVSGSLTDIELQIDEDLSVLVKNRLAVADCQRHDLAKAQTLAPPNESLAGGGQIGQS